MFRKLSWNEYLKLKYNGLWKREWLRNKKSLSFSLEEFIAHIDKINQTHCGFCGFILNFQSPLRSERPGIDHIIPLSQGGETVLSNLTFICQFCNYFKGDMSVSNYKELAEMLVQKGVRGEYQIGRKQLPDQN